MTGKCWEVGKYDSEPQPVEVVKETEAKVSIKETWFGEQIRQSWRMKRGLHLFATWEEARAYIVEIARTKRDIAVRELARAEALHRE